MKTTPRRALFVATALFAVALFATAQQQLGGGQRLSPSEVKTLIKSASTPEDHLKLAEYFRQEAAAEVAAAKLHEEMAEIYEPGPLPSNFKPPSVAEMKGHCREFARNATKASETALKMAAEHEKLAELMRTAPPSGGRRSR